MGSLEEEKFQPRAGEEGTFEDYLKGGLGGKIPCPEGGAWPVCRVEEQTCFLEDRKKPQVGCVVFGVRSSKWEELGWVRAGQRMGRDHV